MPKSGSYVTTRVKLNLTVKRARIPRKWDLAFTRIHYAACFASTHRQHETAYGSAIAELCLSANWHGSDVYPRKNEIPQIVRTYSAKCHVRHHAETG